MAAVESPSLEVPFSVDLLNLLRSVQAAAVSDDRRPLTGVVVRLQRELLAHLEAQQAELLRLAAPVQAVVLRSQEQLLAHVTGTPVEGDDDASSRAWLRWAAQAADLLRRQAQLEAGLAGQSHARNRSAAVATSGGEK